MKDLPKNMPDQFVVARVSIHPPKRNWIHFDSAWVDVKLGLVRCHLSKWRNGELHNPGGLAFDMNGMNVVGRVESMLRPRRELRIWIDDGKTRWGFSEKVRKGADYVNVNFPAGIPVRFTNRVAFDFFTWKYEGLAMFPPKGAFVWSDFFQPRIKWGSRNVERCFRIFQRGAHSCAAYCDWEKFGGRLRSRMKRHLRHSVPRGPGFRWRQEQAQKAIDALFLSRSGIRRACEKAVERRCRKHPESADRVRRFFRMMAGAGALAGKNAEN